MTECDFFTHKELPSVHWHFCSYWIEGRGKVGREEGQEMERLQTAFKLPFWTAFVYINRERAHGIAIFQQCTVDIPRFFQRRENSKRTPGGRGEVR